MKTTHKNYTTLICIWAFVTLVGCGRPTSQQAPKNSEGAVAITHEPTAEELLSEIHSRDSSKKIHAIDIARKLGSRAAALIPDLIKIMDSKKAPLEHRIRAIGALGEMGSFGTSGVRPLRLNLQESDNPKIRAASAWALGRLSPFSAGAAENLAEALKNEGDPEVKLAVIFALGELREYSIDSLEALKLISEDLKETEAIRKMAKLAVGKIQPESSP